MNDILINSGKIQAQASAVIEKLDLLALLAIAGEVKTVGSYDYQLMTWPDLDFDVVTYPTIPVKKIANIMAQIASSEQFQRINFVDNRQQVELDRPKSIYLGLNYWDNESNLYWKIDIRFLQLQDVNSDKTALLIKEKLTPETKLIILDLKNQLDSHPGYHHLFYSTDIYQAVLLADIKNLSDFKKYLVTKGIDLT